MCFGQVEGGAVVEVRADDLHADRQAVGARADRDDGRREVGGTGRARSSGTAPCRNGRRRRSPPTGSTCCPRDRGGSPARGWIGIRIASKPSKNRATFSRSCSRRSLWPSQSWWRIAVPRIAAPRWVSSVLAAMWSSASGGNPLASAANSSGQVDVRDLLETEDGPGVDVDASTGRFDRLDERRQHPRGVGVDRAPRIVEPARRCGTSPTRRRCSAGDRAATPARSSDRARRARRVRPRGRRPIAPSGRRRRCRPR